MLNKSVMRISEKPIVKYPCYLHPFFWSQKRKYGQVLKPGLLLGQGPETVHGRGNAVRRVGQEKQPIGSRTTFPGDGAGVANKPVPFLCRH